MSPILKDRALEIMIDGIGIKPAIAHQNINRLEKDPSMMIKFHQWIIAFDEGKIIFIDQKNDDALTLSV